MAYTFDKVNTNGTWRVEVDTKENYGHFENQVNGGGGGLWFVKENGLLVLEDYDGVFQLPTQVIDCLLEMDILVDESFE